MTTTAAANSASPSNDYPIQQPPESPGVVPMDQDQETTTNNKEPQPQPPNASKQQQPQPPPPQQQQSESQESEPPISQQPPPTTPPLSQQQANSEQRRPMNAFLVFCKSRRSDLRNKFKDLDNRNVTRMLGLEWSKLDKDSKKIYHDKARQHKEAFMKANPDFKWCKTPMSSSNNNCNTNNSLNSNSNSNDCYATNNRHSEPLPTAHSVDHQHHNIHHNNQAVVHQSNSSGSSSNSSTSSTTSTTARTTTTTNNKDTFANNNHRQLQQQHEAPKPPKKRFLEKNNSSMMYSTKNSSNIINSNSNNFSTNNEPILQHVRDQFPPMKFHDQDIYDKVIEDAFKETEADESPKAMCKYPSRCSTNNLTASSANQLGVIPNISYSSTPSSTTISTAPSYSSNLVGDEQPVDFSMNRTITHTRQEIIDELVEQMLSGPTDTNPGNTSKLNGTDSVRRKINPPGEER